MYTAKDERPQVNQELIRKSRKACEKITENIYVAANEPTLACYQIQEHVHKTIPILLNKKIQMNKNEAQLKGLLYDIEYCYPSIKSIETSRDTFESIQKMLKECIFYKQQIDYNESVKKRIEERVQRQQKQFSESKESEPTVPKVATARRNIRSTSKSFNRFSASFDFPSSLPTVASSVSADLKSLISQLTHSKPTSQNSPPNLVQSSSLQILTETAETEDNPPKPTGQESDNLES